MLEGRSEAACLMKGTKSRRIEEQPEDINDQITNGPSQFLVVESLTREARIS